MDPTYEYLWAAGYDLPPDDRSYNGGKPIVEAMQSDLNFGVYPRRGKKAARAKREKAKP